MKVALRRGYRSWMFARLPATLGIGTAVLWARSLRWPRNVDAQGLTLGYRRKVPWRPIERIGVWRNYCNGDVSRIDIHHDGSIDRVPVRSLQDAKDRAHNSCTVQGGAPRSPTNFFPNKLGATMKHLVVHLTRAESLQAAQAVPRQETASSIKARFSELWPRVLVWLGIALTIAWSGSLAWLALRLLDIV
jgi:hypothetical protein